MENNLPGIIEQNNSSEMPTTQGGHQQPKKKQKKLVYVLVCALICVLMMVGVFLVSKNSSAPKNNEKQSQQQWKLIVKPTSGITDFTYKIVEGSLYRVSSRGEAELFIDKSLLKHPQLEVSRIHDFTLSPDMSKIVLYTESSITPLLLYYVDLDTKESIFISPGEEIAWSPNSRFIAFTRRPADVGPLGLYVFDTSLNEEIETIQPENRVFINYSDLKWSPDSSSILTNYETRDDIPYGNIIDEGETQIKLK